MTSPAMTTIARKVKAMRIAIRNTIGDYQIQELVAAYGYTSAKMSEGQQIYLKAASAVSAQTYAAGEQRDATRRAHSTYQRARTSYQALAQLTRAVFMRDPATLTKLGLNGTMPASSAEFLKAANTLLDNVVKDQAIIETLASYGYDTARIGQERDVIEAFSQAGEAQVAAIGAAQQATRDQKAALATMSDWLAQYFKIAKIALHDKPQMYENIGGVVRAVRTEAQRQAPKKAAATRAAKKAT